MKIKLIIISIGLLLVAAGCPRESEELLNPPSFKESVFVRLANLTNDDISLEMLLEPTDELFTTGELGFLEISKGLNPPSDSAIIDVRINGELQLDTLPYYQFSRGFNFLFIAVPSIEDRSFDTIIDFSNLGDSNLDRVNAQVKVFNAIPDTTIKLVVNVGCPGGQDVTGFPIAFKEFSFGEAIRAGEEISLTVLFQRGNELEQMSTFEYRFEQGGEYTVIATRNEADRVELFVIDENDIEMEMLVPMEEVEQKFTELRLINLTDNPISLSKNSEEVITDVEPNLISEYSPVAACVSINSETFTLSSNTMSFLYAPDVNQKYTGIVYTSEFSGLDTLVFIDPPEINEVRDGRLHIRTMNLSEPETGLTISFGANSSSALEFGDRGFSSGTSLATDLSYGVISDGVFINPGIKPLIIFTSNEPGRYINSSLLDLEFTGTNSDNGFIFGNRRNGVQNFYYVSEETPSGNLVPLETAVLTGIVNAYPSSESSIFALTTSIGNVLTDAQVLYQSGVTTLSSIGDNTIISDGVSLNYNVNAINRVLLIKTGQGNGEFFEVQDLPMNPSNLNYKWRFINAATDIPRISVTKSDGGPEQPVVSGLGYKEVSLVETIEVQSQIGLKFYNNATGEELLTTLNVPVSRNKAYSMIFAGEAGNYSLIIQQEF